MCRTGEGKDDIAYSSDDGEEMSEVLTTGEEESMSADNDESEEESEVGLGDENKDEDDNDDDNEDDNEDEGVDEDDEPTQTDLDMVTSLLMYSVI